MKRTLLLLIVLLTVGIQAAWAQNRTFTGRVLDDRGQGIPSAAVSIPGTQAGTVTDIDGNFTLAMPANTNTVTVQAIGYASQTITVGNSPITVRMQIAAKELSGAVVTALAIRREKRELGYSASTLSNADLTNGNNVSALSAIQGKVAGANITSSTGGPGGSTRIVLRGEKSLTGNNNALLVVDGIPISNTSRTSGTALSQIDFGNQGNDINPDDIESITVLKGPAAAALYGSIGANGAVMITTKSGKSRHGKSKTEVTVESKYTLSSILKYPELQNKYGQGNIYDGIADDHRENFSWGLPFDGQLRPWGQVIDGNQLVKPYSAIKNNIKDFYNIGKTWENTASFGGGGDNSSFYLSLNALNNDGVTPYTFYNKYSVRFNAATTFANKFYANINLNYLNINSRVETQGQSAGGAGSVWEDLIQTPRDIPVAELKDLNNKYYGMSFTDATGVNRYGFYGAYANNPYWTAQNYDNRDVTNRIIGSATVGIKPNDHWNIYDRVGMDFVSDGITSKIPKYTLLPFDEAYYSDPSGNLQTHTNNGGYFQSDENSMNFYNDVIANYNTQLNEDIGLDLTLGNNVTIIRDRYLSDNIDPVANGLVNPGFYSFTNAQNTNVAPVNTVTERAIIGAYGDLRLDYRRQLFLELTGRNDWTSTLAPTNRSYFYPSANLSWVFTETFKNDFTRNILSFGKLRGGYASVGNGAGAYQNNPARFVVGSAATGFGTVNLPFITTQNGSPVQVPGFALQTGIGDSSLRPERTNAFEAGVDLGFLKDRISVEFTYYHNHSIDQIVPIPVAPTSGYLSQVVNVGDVTNKGIELSARVTPIRTRTGFRWDLFGTYTKNTNRVDRLNAGTNQINLGGSTEMSVVAAVGKPFGEFYGTDLLTDGKGHVVVDSASGMPKLNTTGVYKGSYQPKFIASWGTTLSYKGFSLNLTFYTKQGGKFYSSTKDLMDFVGTAKETENRDPYVFPNSVYENAAGQYVTNSTKFSPYDYYTNVIPAGQHVIDASYVKLQEASLYYTLPSKWTKHTFFGDARIGVYGNNLIIWTSEENKYVDPEVNTGGSTNLQGYDFRARPSLRNYGISVRLTF